MILCKQLHFGTSANGNDGLPTEQCTLHPILCNAQNGTHQQPAAVLTTDQLCCAAGAGCSQDSAGCNCAAAAANARTHDRAAVARTAAAAVLMASGFAGVTFVRCRQGRCGGGGGPGAAAAHPGWAPLPDAAQPGGAAAAVTQKTRNHTKGSAAAAARAARTEPAARAPGDVLIARAVLAMAAALAAVDVAATAHRC